MTNNYIKRESNDRLVRILIRFSGVFTILVLGGILFMLSYNTVAFFFHSGPIDFFTGIQWRPTETQEKYGILPLITGTLMVSIGAMLIAIPLGIGAAAFMSEFAKPGLRAVLKPTIEMLASIPSVAIGFLGIVLVGLAIARIFGIENGINALNGCVLLAVMALPTIITISEDSIRSVPFTYREASIGLGANKWATLFRVTIPAATPGIIAAVMLGLGRALGETMTVLMATGNTAAMPKGFLDSVRTITATIAIEMGEVPYQTTHYFALFAIAAVLFLITLAINMAGEYYSNRLRKFQEQ